MSRNGLIIGTAVAAAAVGFIAAREAFAKYEEPNYSVTQKDGNIEVRQYPRVIAAEVTVSGTGSTAADSAFKILAGYIFGKNKSDSKIAMTIPVTDQVSSEKIAMTVPVTTQSSGTSMQMRFFMPSHYSLSTLPQPLDDRVKFLEMPGQRYAVIRFSGLAHEASIQQHTSDLMDYLRAHSLEANGSPVRAFYNPPWTLPFLRRNEVWIPIKE